MAITEALINYPSPKGALICIWLPHTPYYARQLFLLSPLCVSLAVAVCLSACRCLYGLQACDLFTEWQALSAKLSVMRLKCGVFYASGVGPLMKSAFAWLVVSGWGWFRRGVTPDAFPPLTTWQKSRQRSVSQSLCIQGFYKALRKVTIRSLIRFWQLCPTFVVCFPSMNERNVQKCLHFRPFPITALKIDDVCLCPADPFFCIRA